METREGLRRKLARMDGRGYKAYRELEGSYDFGPFVLFVDHVQADPFAAPSKIRLRVPMGTAKLPPHLHRGKVARMALEDFMARHVQEAVRASAAGHRASAGSGQISMDAGGQEVVERTGCRVSEDWVEARLYAGLPASGRRVLGGQAEQMLCHRLVEIVQQGLVWDRVSEPAAEGFVRCVENQEHIRAKLEQLRRVAFVADGSVLPRESGNSQAPMPRHKAVPFRSPDSLRVTLSLPQPVGDEWGGGKTLTGMGIPRGVTLVVGGGYHGKSTLLQALEGGVYPHVQGDGREYVVTCADAMKIRAEDGRRVEKVDISPFITHLPFGQDTSGFCTENASGSTSQAANIVEALEMGSRLLLLDEDTSATNFMVRDVRMQQLVEKRFEPITPFIDRVREICGTLGVSTVLVMGGCGDYFEVADTVIMMRGYVPHDVTGQARKVAAEQVTHRRAETEPCPSWRLSRIPLPRSFDASRGRREVNIDARSADQILFGTDVIDLRGVDQLLDSSQTRAVGLSIHLAASRFMGQGVSLRQVLDRLVAFLDREGIDALDPFHHGKRHPGSLARPRPQEIAAAINRLRALDMESAS